MARRRPKAVLEAQIADALRRPAVAYHDDHLCSNCGQKFSHHAAHGNPYAAEGACPSAREFPKWPSTIRDEAKAGRLFDERVERFWRASPGAFRPKV